MLLLVDKWKLCKTKVINGSRIQFNGTRATTSIDIAQHYWQSNYGVIATMGRSSSGRIAIDLFRQRAHRVVHGVSMLRHKSLVLVCMLCVFRINLNISYGW